VLGDFHCRRRARAGLSTNVHVESLRGFPRCVCGGGGGRVAGQVDRSHRHHDGAACRPQGGVA
jgi:hypothetical protein